MEYSLYVQLERSRVPRSASLADTISGLNRQLRNMRDDLLEAQRENALLRRRSQATESQPRPILDLDLGALRRGLAFYCHPDRGGDESLMGNVNMLLDHLELAQRPRNDTGRRTGQ